MVNNTTVTEVTMYKTEDGQVFNTKQEAEQHVSRANLIEKLEAGIYCRDTSGEEIADWIIENLKFSFK